MADKEKQKKAIAIATLFVDVATPFWQDTDVLSIPSSQES